MRLEYTNNRTSPIKTCTVYISTAKTNFLKKKTGLRRPAPRVAFCSLRVAVEWMSDLDEVVVDDAPVGTEA